MVEVPLLGQVGVSVSVKLNHLVLPSAVVELSASYFEAASPPSGDVVEDYTISSSDVRMFKSTIANNAVVGSLPDELDVVDGQSVAIRASSCLELEHVLSVVDSDVDPEVVDSVVVGSDVGDLVSVPVDDSLA